MIEKKSESVTLDPQKMFRHGCAFADCAKVGEVERDGVVEYRTLSHISASIVNSAFACEVFLKALLVFQGVDIRKKRIHKLQDLWREYAVQDPQSANLVEKHINDEFTTKSNDTFNKNLHLASNAFEHWRYIYEYNHGEINRNFLYYFRRTLRDMCCKNIFNQSWKEYKSNGNLRDQGEHRR